MKKPITIVLIVVAVLAVGGIAYWLGTRTNKNINQSQTNLAQENKNTAAITNTPIPSATYETYTSHGPLYTFDTVKEWTSIAAAEIQKSVTEEQRHGYNIVYFSSNPDTVTLAVSEKKSAELTTIQQIIADDKSEAAKNPNITITDERIGQSDARIEMKVQSGTSEFIVYSRYLIISTVNGETSWALMEISVPGSRVNQYKGIISHLQDSLKLTNS